MRPGARSGSARTAEPARFATRSWLFARSPGYARTAYKDYPAPAFAYADQWPGGRDAATGRRGFTDIPDTSARDLSAPLYGALAILAAVIRASRDGEVRSSSSAVEWRGQTSIGMQRDLPRYERPSPRSPANRVTTSKRAPDRGHERRRSLPDLAKLRRTICSWQ